jgi:hypothetical protein
MAFTSRLSSLATDIMALANLSRPASLASALKLPAITNQASSNARVIALKGFGAVDRTLYEMVSYHGGHLLRG